MSLFDILGGGGRDLLGIIDENPQPRPERPRPRTDLEKKIIKKVREEVDKHIDPESTLGEKIHKFRQADEQYDEKLRNQETAYKNLFYDESDAVDKAQFEPADHLFVRSGPITHHAIYVGYDRVIHYAFNPDGAIEIHRASLSEFSEGKKIYCMKESVSPLKYSRSEAVKRAEVRVGEKKYDLVDNNCEHFVRWCRSGGEKWVWEQD